MNAGTDWLRELFDEVMRAPESARGMDVEETCRLLAERVKQRTTPAEYAEAMRKLQAIYLDQFIHTCMADPTFAPAVRSAIGLYI